MSTSIHNNSILQNSGANRGIRASEAQNESNGMGAAGYFCLLGEQEAAKEDDYRDRSELLTSALVGLAAINLSKMSVRSGLLNKLASKRANEAIASIA